MTLKEMLASKKAELAKLKDAVEAGDDDAIATAEELVADIDEIQEKVDAAAKKAAILAHLGSNDPTEPADDTAKGGTVGQKAAAAIKSAGWARTERRTINVDGSKADGDSQTPTTPTTTTPTFNSTPSGYIPATQEIRPDVLEGARRPMTVAALFGQETTERQAVTYYVEGAVDGEPETVAEGGKYPLITFGDPTSKTDPVKKIGCVYKDTDELLDDADRLAQQIDSRAMYLMDMTEEDQLLNGDGTGNNIVGLLKRSGLQTATATMGAKLIEAIKTAKTGIRKNTPGFSADGVLINDEDWDTLTNTKDGQGNYMIGNPFLVDGEGVKPWGVTVVPTPAIAKGTVVVGAFKMGASVIRNGSRGVEVTNSNDKDFENGLVAFRPSERLALAVRYPAAFVKITVTTPAA